METISRYLLTFLLNSVWQIPLAAAVAAGVCRLMRNGPASHRHAVWVAALLAAILLPVASVRTGEPAAPLRLALPDAPPTVTLAAPAALAAGPAPARSTPVQDGRTVSFARTTAMVLLAAYFLFVLWRMVRLAWAAMRTIQIRRSAHAGVTPLPLQDVWARCLTAFDLREVHLLSSTKVSGPVTAGRTIILPQSLLSETAEDLLTTAIGHEMAHISRHDFAFNLLYELLYLPASFHPAAWLIHRNIERTREMASDELVTHRLLDAGVYARSIMSIAAGMTALPHPGYTLGVFDGDILEERIRHLIERPVANLKRARLLLIAGLSALAVCAVVASGLALTARAQSGSYAEMKLAETAYNRGDFAGAVERFENAVKLDPASIKAKLFLAMALLQQYNPSSQPDAAESPIPARARQQYLDVLARDSKSKVAIEGLLTIANNTRQNAEAHDWALKLIAVDPTDKEGYYTAAFVDWVTVYPEYARARTAAGMNLEDPGIIPDASLRKSLRGQHQARIEEGFRMLQVALELDPDYGNAMAYMNLLYRIESCIVDSPAESAEMVAKADDWVTKALAAKRKSARNPLPAATQLDVDRPVSGPSGAGDFFAAPPPPPPPPPPPVAGDQAASAAPPFRPRNVAERTAPFWQVMGSTDMPANALAGLLKAKGFSASLLGGQDNLVRVVVGPYPDQQSLDQAKGALEAAGFRAVRVW
jgi:beta-lactamase regulating signal transducer with metallopeptidase domain/cell division septation protein DedD